MNRLQHASSPYLRQHADNPVDWYEWGEEAFATAREEDKPVFLSVGYASCHWCHVMAHESFEDEDVARVLNAGFVSIKVDREERPDVDSVYMSAVQALTGHGGWPMSVFCTPEGTPFFGGTYWPKQDRQGMPGFLRVLEAVQEAWTGQREEVRSSAEKLTAHLRAVNELAAGESELDTGVAEIAASGCERMWDREHGGFGGAPKFPQAMTIDFLLAHHLRTGNETAADAAVQTLHAMARGGIYDHVGGGFHRYAVDAHWLVPHFEKMLYDNALLLRAYTHAWQLTGHPRFRRIVSETATYLLREMQHPDGGFFSSTDADSEGIEGAFFVWSAEEFAEVVADAGEDPQRWASHYGVSPEGNFADPHRPDFGRRTILHEAGPDQGDDVVPADARERVRAALYERRSKRVPPGLDDKVLTSWNALAIGALAEAGAVFGEPAWIDAADRAVRFLRSALVADGRLRHTWRAGHGASVPAFLEDVAYLAQGLLVLYEADHDPAWFTWAAELARDADDRFAEREDEGCTGAWFATPHDGEALIARPKDLWDNATPSGASVMADVHLRLAALTGQEHHLDRATRTLGLFATRAVQASTAYGELLRALERYAGGMQEVAVAGDPRHEGTRALVAAYRESWRPSAVLAVGEPDDDHAVPLLAHRQRVQGRPTAYVCRGFACEAPVTDPDALRDQLAA